MVLDERQEFIRRRNLFAIDGNDQVGLAAIDLSLLDDERAAPFLLAMSPAPQNDQAWNDWVYRANSIIRAAETGDERQVQIMCRNIVREMMAKPGLPPWTRELVGTCEALKEGLARGRSGSFCRKAKENARAFRKATPVAEERRAYPLAMQLAEMMETLHKGLC